MLEPTADSFRALARSSPWRWRRLHLTWHRPSYGDVEAWVDRPGRMRVREGRDVLTVEEGPGSSGSGYGGVPPPPEYARTYPWREVSPQEVEPTYRDADGLVAERPQWVVEGRLEVKYGDPLWQTYQWVAMLDPVELADHVEIADVGESEIAGRRTWTAWARPLDGYRPVCGCCALLWSEISDRDEYGEDHRPPRGSSYPDAYAVSLDVVTGIVVGLTPIGGAGVAPWTTTIHAVDGADPF